MGYRKSDLFEIIFLSLLIMFDLIGWAARDFGDYSIFYTSGNLPIIALG